jgi:hypothetical protein
MIPGEVKGEPSVCDITYEGASIPSFLCRRLMLHAWAEILTIVMGPLSREKRLHFVSKAG